MLTIIPLFFVILISTSTCGAFRHPGDSANPLSVGGNYIQQGECPWLSPIYYKRTERETIYLCGSSLITDQFVATAAHCVRAKSSSEPLPKASLLIYTGIYDLDDPLNENVNVHQVQELITHPNWNVSTQRFDADIALIKLTKPATFSKFVQRIALPSAEFARSEAQGLVVGFGKSESDRKHENKPKRIQIPIVDTEECYQNHEVFSYLKSRDAFCAGKNGVIPCNGDSGSSFYLIDNSSPILIGIVSSGIRELSGKCKDDAYVLFTDVYKFVDWIIKEVGSGYIVSERKDGPAAVDFKANDAFCEYTVDDGYRCTLRGVRSAASNTKVTGIHGQHKDGNDDRDITKVWIVEQEAKFIPDMSEVLKKFPRVRDFRVWTCGLRFVERSKLAVFGGKLRVLDLFNNQIEEIPEDAFTDLVNLEELKILNNRVRKLPENLLSNLRNLKYFFAENNEIEEIPKNFFKSTQIAVVSMKNNRLKKIFVDFRDLRNVNVIDFNNNNCINLCLGHYCGKMSVSEMQREIEQKCH